MQVGWQNKVNYDNITTKNSSYSGLPVKCIQIWDQTLFIHIDLTMFCLSVFSLIANVNLLHHRLNKIKHCLVQ